MNSSSQRQRDLNHHQASQGQGHQQQGQAQQQQQQPGPQAPPTDLYSFLAGYNETRRYTVLNLIGKGSYGVVCAAKDNLTGEVVAIKKIQNVFDNVADAHRILREITLLRLLKHPDIVEIKHIMLPSDPRTFKDLYVCFELMESDLHTVIGANDDLTRDHHKVFLYQLLRGLNFMHINGVLHRDLKPKNILANSNCKLKICDFGLARPDMRANVAPLTPVIWTDYVATRWYRAPELCGCFYGRYSSAVDMWSIGCIFAEVLLGKPLFPGRDAVSQLQLITDLLGKPPPSVIEGISNPRARRWLQQLPHKEPRPLTSKFPNADPLALELLGRLLAFDPAERPTAAEALAHSYFTNLPDAVRQESVPVAASFMEFENCPRLSEADVRRLIYMEALHYHPKVLAAYRNQMAPQQVDLAHMPGNQSNPYTLAGSNSDSVSLQFMMMGDSSQQDSGASTSTDMELPAPPMPQMQLPPPPTQVVVPHQTPPQQMQQPQQTPPQQMQHMPLQPPPPAAVFGTLPVGAGTGAPVAAGIWRMGPHAGQPLPPQPQQQQQRAPPPPQPPPPPQQQQPLTSIYPEIYQYSHAAAYHHHHHQQQQAHQLQQQAQQLQQQAQQQQQQQYYPAILGAGMYYGAPSMLHPQQQQQLQQHQLQQQAQQLQQQQLQIQQLQQQQQQQAQQQQQQQQRSTPKYSGGGSAYSFGHHGY